MKEKILNKNDLEISFLVEGINYAFANELRRIMIGEIPTMAIEWVDFRSNDSPMPDELMANRLGQIPLTFDKKAYELPENCKCEGKGCSRCQTELVLKKKGPGMVYSGDLKSKDKTVRPVFDKIPIVELFEGQEIEFEATAQLGFGKNHAKWQAAVVGYKNAPNIIISTANCNGESCRKCVEKCVKNPKVLTVERGKIVLTDSLVCNMCMQCVDVCPKNAIKVETIEDSFIFNVESVSGLNPEEIVVQAAEILEEKSNQFEKGLGKLK
jgi:DNA-directed RNA polymerase subunit D